MEKKTDEPHKRAVIKMRLEQLERGPFGSNTSPMKVGSHLRQPMFPGSALLTNSLDIHQAARELAAKTVAQSTMMANNAALKAESSNTSATEGANGLKSPDLEISNSRIMSPPSRHTPVGSPWNSHESPRAASNQSQTDSQTKVSFSSMTSKQLNMNAQETPRVSNQPNISKSTVTFSQVNGKEGAPPNNTNTIQGESEDVQFKCDNLKFEEFDNFKRNHPPNQTVPEDNGILTLPDHRSPTANPISTSFNQSQRGQGSDEKSPNAERVALPGGVLPPTFPRGFGMTPMERLAMAGSSALHHSSAHGFPMQHNPLQGGIPHVPPMRGMPSPMGMTGHLPPISPGGVLGMPTHLSRQATPQLPDPADQEAIVSALQSLAGAMKH